MLSGVPAAFWPPRRGFESGYVTSSEELFLFFIYKRALLGVKPSPGFGFLPAGCEIETEIGIRAQVGRGSGREFLGDLAKSHARARAR